MANPEQAAEPSMEEILASIRKIISDDDETGEDGEAAPDAPPEDQQDAEFEAMDGDGDVFEDAGGGPAASSDGDMTAEMADADVFEKADTADNDTDVLSLGDFAIHEDDAAGADKDASKVEIVPPIGDDLDFSAADEADAAPAGKDKPDTAAAASGPATADGMNSDMKSLGPNESILSNEADAAVSAAFGSLANVMLSNNARTLEDLVKEILRPMLKAWLDDNLPPLVERLVREEIERVSRGRR